MYKESQITIRKQYLRAPLMPFSSSCARAFFFELRSCLFLRAVLEAQDRERPALYGGHLRARPGLAKYGAHVMARPGGQAVLPPCAFPFRLPPCPVPAAQLLVGPTLPPCVIPFRHAHRPVPTAQPPVELRHRRTSFPSATLLILCRRRRRLSFAIAVRHSLPPGSLFCAGGAAAG